MSDLDRRSADRRSSDRRLTDRRIADGRQNANGIALVHGERRSGMDRRSSDRRGSPERRVPLQTPADQVRWAIDLVARVAESGEMGEAELRALDAAIVRLRFALERLAKSA